MQDSLEKCLTKLTCDAAENCAEGVFFLPPDFPAFNGHFPGQPIFPAFVQLVAVRLVAARVSGCRLRPKTTGKIKFSGMVGPEQEFCIRVGLSRQDNDWLAKFTITRAADKVASGTMLYGESE